MLKLFKVNETDESLVIEYVYHLLVAILADKLPLNPEPEIDPPAVPQVTPTPLEIWEKISPVGCVDIVEIGVAGQVIVVIAE